MLKINSIAIRRSGLWRNIEYNHFKRYSETGYFVRNPSSKYLQSLYKWYYRPVGWWKKNKIEQHKCRECIQSNNKRKEEISNANFLDMLKEALDKS